SGSPVRSWKPTAGSGCTARSTPSARTSAVERTREDTPMHDLVIRGGVVVEVGRVDGGARREIDADGLLVTPGFVDVHTHFDGQATWDPHLTPSCWHGVTTAMLGNC